jgi:hypothetical protein
VEVATMKRIVVRAPPRASFVRSPRKVPNEAPSSAMYTTVDNVKGKMTCEKLERCQGEQNDQSLCKTRVKAQNGHAVTAKHQDIPAMFLKLRMVGGGLGGVGHVGYCQLGNCTRLGSVKESDDKTMHSGCASCRL